MINKVKVRLSRLSQGFFYFFVWMTFYLLACLFVTIKLEGKENIPKRGRFIVSGNHQNFFDGYLLAYVSGPFKKINFIIAKRALNRRSWVILAKLIGSALIGNDIEEYQRAVKKLNNVLSHGGAVGIFPEGDVSSRKIPRKFKGGVAKLSLDSKTKVIPVYISGTYNLRYLKYLLQRPEILIKIGKPVELYNYAGICRNNLDEMASVLREKVIELMEVKEATELKIHEQIPDSREPVISY